MSKCEICGGLHSDWKGGVCICMKEPEAPTCEDCGRLPKNCICEPPSPSEFDYGLARKFFEDTEAPTVFTVLGPQPEPAKAQAPGARGWTLIVRGEPAHESTWHWGVLGAKATEYHDDTPVIERAAYEALERELAEAKLPFSMDRHVELMKAYEQARAELADERKENARLNEIIDDAADIENGLRAEIERLRADYEHECETIREMKDKLSAAEARVKELEAERTRLHHIIQVYEEDAQ